MPINFEPIGKPKIDFTPQEDSSVATLDFQPVEPKKKKGLGQFLLEPISKQITGKSLGERTNFLNKASADIIKKSNRKISVPEAFIRQLPAATGQALANLVDLSPLDVGIMAATGGIGKIPVKGTTVGEIAKTIPIGKGFMKNVKELGGYQQALKNLPVRVAESQLPLKTIKETFKGVTKTPDFAENINLTKYPKDVRNTINDLVSKTPELGKTPKISDAELIKRASQLKDTPTIKHLATLPEGTVEAEALKLRQGNTEAIRSALSGELTELKNNLDVIQSGIGLHRKTASMFGRGLRQQKLPAETQQQMAFVIDDTIKKISKDPVFGKDQELIDTVKKLRSIVVEKEFNPTLWNKVYFTWMNSILSNPFTHVVNTASNTYFALSKIPEKFASAVWDLPLALKTGKRTQFFGEIPAMLKGMVNKEKLPEGIKWGSKIDIAGSPIRGKVGKVIGLPTKLLQVEDNLAKTMVGKMELYAQRYAGKTGEALTKAVNEEQLYRTFQNDVGIVGNSLLVLKNRIPLLRYVIPFIKTPENLITRGLERTPLVGIKIARKVIGKTYTQEALSKDLGNLTLGTIGAGWVGLQWAKGNITGRVPSDQAQRDAFYRQGKKPNAIKISNKWIPFDRLEPLGTSISTMVNMIQDYSKSDKANPVDKTIEAFTKLGSTLTNKTYLSGFTGMINALSNPERYGQSFLSRIATGVEPQLLNFFAGLKDPYYREANSILEQLKAKTPFLSETLPPKLNVLGEPVKRDFLNIGKVNEAPIEKLLAETPIGFPNKTMGKEKLTPKEYRYITEESGKQIRGILQNINVDDFLKLPIETREEIISELVNKSRKPYRGIVRGQRELNKANIDFQPVE